jgi:hypothetical protein
MPVQSLAALTHPLVQVKLRDLLCQPSLNVLYGETTRAGMTRLND